MGVGFQKIKNFNMTPEECKKKIQDLNSTLWDNRVRGPRIDEWLNNFSDDLEKDYALYILSRMMYYSSLNIRSLLKSLYRDLYRYPLIKDIREKNNDTIDASIIEKQFLQELNKTRFLGVGNPSESGVHLLYFFRQENKIRRDLFVNTDDVIRYDDDNKPYINEAFKDVKRFVFIDDLCGSGIQATSDDSNVRRCVGNIRNVVDNAEISYFMLFGLSNGVEYVRNYEFCGKKLYDHVEALIELDGSYRCFGDTSRFFNDGYHDKEIARNIAHKYGYKLAYDLSEKEGYTEYTSPTIAEQSEYRALGWGDCQLLLSMYYNTPDNTLPIIWYDENDELWTPIFKRYNKVY